MRVATAVLLGVAAVTSLGAVPQRSAVYLGVRACGACHSSHQSGNQLGRWLETRHSRAYASLSLPSSLEMARRSGVTGDPHRSPICLGCHATGSQAEPWQRDPEFRIEDGVQCEKCHGPGSEYVEVMSDPEAARRAGLVTPTKQDCLKCHYVKASHASVHGKPPLDVDAAWSTIAHPRPPAGTALAGEPPSDPLTALDRLRETVAELSAAVASPPSSPRYKTPRNLCVRPGGREVWVACEASDSVVVVDALRREKVAEIAVGGQPHDVAFAPDGRRAYVSNRLDDTVSVLDADSHQVVAVVAVGDEPHGLLTDAAGKWLYVLNSASGDVSVVDTHSLEEVKRLAASRNPWSLALSPDGTRLAVTNTLSRFVPFRSPSLSEVTVVDAQQGRVVDRLAVPAANLLQGVAWRPSGELALFTLNRTKNLVPMTRLQQGWTITNGLGIAWRDGRVDQVLLDEPNACFADAADVAISPDGRLALVTSQGTDRVAVVDVDRLVALVRAASDRERAEVLPDHLGKSSEFVVGYVPTGKAPRGVVFTPDGRTAFVANQLDDSLTAIDVARLQPVGRVDLGGPTTVTTVRRGEQLFHSAKIAFARQFSCASCHPDGHVDGLTYDIEADGIGVSPVDNRTLRGIYDTDPFKWEGTNPTLARQCGARLAVFFTRIQPFTPEELAAVNEYTTTIPRPPNRHRALGAELTPAQARGKAVFERTRTNDGREIPVDGRCVTCHFPPYFTDRSKRDVGTKYTYDRQGSFDVPHLNNIYDSAPYLHNGMANTLEEIWTRFNPNDTHGVTNDMTKDQLNDLVEYLKTL